MSITKRRQIKAKQQLKRRNRRVKLKKQGQNPDEFYSDGLYMGPHKSK